jgi:hypothetical protein
MVRLNAADSWWSEENSMPSWQFLTELNPNQTVNVPPEIAGLLRPGDEVRIVLATTDEDESDWRRLTLEQFFKGYGPGDEIYDQLPVR